LKFKVVVKEEKQNTVSIARCAEQVLLSQVLHALLCIYH